MSRSTSGRLSRHCYEIGIFRVVVRLVGLHARVLARIPLTLATLMMLPVPAPP
jgi:hypothetical protein